MDKLSVVGRRRLKTHLTIGQGCRLPFESSFTDPRIVYLLFVAAQ